MTYKNINNYIFIPFLIALIFFQLTFIPQLFPNPSTPNLALILLISASLLYKTAGIIYIAFFSGIMLDIYAGTSFGFLTISIIVSILLSSYLGNSFLNQLFSFRSILISLTGILAYSLIYFFLTSGGSYALIYSNLNYALSAAIANMLCAIFLTYPFLYLISSRKQNEK